MYKIRSIISTPYFEYVTLIIIKQASSQKVNLRL